MALITPDELITVQEFADRYRVQTSIVRYWIKLGYIKAHLVGPRHMLVEMVQVSDAVKPINPPGAQLGRFDDYPLSDQYMRCRNGHGQAAEATGNEREAKVGQGGPDQGHGRRKAPRTK